MSGTSFLYLTLASMAEHHQSYKSAHRQGRLTILTQDDATQPHSDTSDQDPDLTKQHFDALRKKLAGRKKIVIISGAGISTSAGSRLMFSSLGLES